MEIYTNAKWTREKSNSVGIEVKFKLGLEGYLGVHPMERGLKHPS